MNPPPLPPFLDDDIIREILSWLPAETLLKLKCVCKSWKSLISDPQFVKLHLQRSYLKNTDFTHIRLMFRCFSFCSVSSLLEKKSKTALLSASNVQRATYRFIGTCNGLISLLNCIDDYGSRKSCNRIRLWNPATRSMSHRSPPLYNEIGNPFDFRFGYDYVSDTYKVVAISTQMVKVYNMGGYCWRSIQSFPPSCREGDGVYLNGTINWIAFQKNGFLINSFDFGDEKCTQLSLPSDFDYVKHGEPTLVILKDCLCVCYESQVTVWQMKKFGVHESWTQLLNITNIHLKVVPLCMSDNDVLLLSKSEKIFFLWNHRENNITACFKAPWAYCTGEHIKNYIGSLVSPR